MKVTAQPEEVYLIEETRRSSAKKVIERRRSAAFRSRGRLNGAGPARHVG